MFNRTMRACAVFYYCCLERRPRPSSGASGGGGGGGGGGTDEESVGGPNYATVMDARAPCNDAVFTGWTREFYAWVNMKFSRS